MGLVVRISATDKPAKVKKAMDQLRKAREKKKQDLLRFYGALPNAFPEGALIYQKKQRDEWG